MSNNALEMRHSKIKHPSISPWACVYFKSSPTPETLSHFFFTICCFIPLPTYKNAPN